MRVLLRDFLAASFRALPYFKGKNRLSLTLTDLLTHYKIESECFVTFRMHDRSLMQLDLRSFEKVAFFSGEYDYGVIQRLVSILKPESTVLDVGANVGFYAIALGHKLKKLGNSSKLWAFEPIETNFNRLVNLISLNELSEVIQPVNVALGNQEGKIQLYLADGQNCAETGNAVWLKGEMIHTIIPSHTSQITKLDVFTQEYKIENCALIKVDIEGAELEFLQGATHFIHKHRPVIYSEFNQHWANEFGYEFIDLVELSNTWKYDLYQQVGRKNFATIKSLPMGLANFLMVPQETSSATLRKLGVLRS